MLFSLRFSFAFIGRPLCHSLDVLKFGAHYIGTYPLIIHAAVSRPLQQLSECKWLGSVLWFFLLAHWFIWGPAKNNNIGNSVGQEMLFTVCPLYGPDSISARGGFWGISTWITYARSLVHQSEWPKTRTIAEKCMVKSGTPWKNVSNLMITRKCLWMNRVYGELQCYIDIVHRGTKMQPWMKLQAWKGPAW